MSARRQARAISVLPVEIESGPPAELYDPDHAVWRDRGRYLKFLARHGLGGSRMPVSERMGVDAHPHNRRNNASAAWGEDNGIENPPGHADWHRLRAMGLIG